MEQLRDILPLHAYQELNAVFGSSSQDGSPQSSAVYPTRVCQKETSRKQACISPPGREQAACHVSDGDILDKPKLAGASLQGDTELRAESCGNQSRSPTLPNPLAVDSQLSFWVARHRTRPPHDTAVKAAVALQLLHGCLADVRANADQLKEASVPTTTRLGTATPTVLDVSNSAKVRRHGDQHLSERSAERLARTPPCPSMHAASTPKTTDVRACAKDLPNLDSFATGHASGIAPSAMVAQTTMAKDALSAGDSRSSVSVAAWIRGLPSSHLPDKERENLAVIVEDRCIDGLEFSNIVADASKLADIGVAAPARAVRVRKAWDQVLREDACRQVASEAFSTAPERKPIKIVV